MLFDERLKPDEMNQPFASKNRFLSQTASNFLYFKLSVMDFAVTHFIWLLKTLQI